MKLLVTGAGGRLGARVVEQARRRGWEVTAWSGSRDFDLRDLIRLRRELERLAPEAVIHTAAMAAVADCYQAPQEAGLVNTAIPALIAEVVPRLLQVSTDMVFDGTSAPYREEDVPAPLSVYASTKREAEVAVLAAGAQHLVARLALLHGPSPHRPGFHETQLQALRAGQPLRLFSDEWRTPITYEAAAAALVALTATSKGGLVHVGGPERLSRYEMGLRLAQSLGLDPAPLIPVPRADVSAPEPRARDLSLDSSRLAGWLA